MNQKILVGAHRGAMCHAPENTLAAFETAIEMGTYRVELDVRRCRGGDLVVIHDATVDRTSDGTGRVADLTLDELKRLRLGGTDEAVPTLREALHCARGRCELLVEIKEAGLAEAVVAEIAGAGMSEHCTASSFLECELLRVRECGGDPRVPTAFFLTEPGPFDAEAVVARLGVSLLVVWPRAASPEAIAAAKRCGLHVRCGFRDDLTYEETFSLFRRMAALGVDEMACGRPDWIRRMADEQHGAS
uniref:Glycerophosphoryl diester phosphodiesterase n=1 Tax=uncultured Armatimonadetes bacterium TaxID=157466 RepID=A0A6J4H3J9_9BACT|nr:Glycerophosphoryl diester phosphodiesterase [uncultured Armatimonadetes bacterium]